LQRDQREVAVDKESGTILEVTWEKMSKSKYNGTDPQGAVNMYGADTVRLFLLFKGPMDGVVDWDEDAIKGQLRWLNRIWAYVVNFIHYHTLKQQNLLVPPNEPEDPLDIESLDQVVVIVNEIIQKVTQDIMNFQFNIAIANLMKLSNVIKDTSGLSPNLKSEDKPLHVQSILETDVIRFALESLVRMLWPMAPHVSSELWEIWRKFYRNLEKIPTWPQFDPTLTISRKTQPLVVQIRGKTVDTLEISDRFGIDDKDEVQRLVMENTKIAKRLKNQTIKKVIVANRTNLLINFVLEKKVQ